MSAIACSASGSLKLILLFSFFIGETLYGQEPASQWSRFRGPNGSGFASNQSPSTWTEKDYAWTQTLPGTGSSSPVIWKDRIVVVSADSATAKRYVSCFDCRSGSNVWTYEFASSPFAKSRDNSYASSTPAAGDQAIYVYWPAPEQIDVLALGRDGKEIWSRKLGPYKSQHGGGASPILYENTVFLNNDQEGESSLVALEATTGKTKWELKRRTDRASYATPCIRDTRSGSAEVIFASSSDGFTGVDPKKGTVNWEFTNAFPFRVVSSPITAGELVLGTCGEGGIGRRLAAVRPGSGTSSPELVYEMKNNLPYVPSLLAVDDLLFLWCDNGLVACHKAATGARIWQHKISDSFYSSPVCAGGNLYCVSKSGIVYVMAAADKPEFKGSVPLGERTFATPAISADAIYFRTESHVFCLKTDARAKP